VGRGITKGDAARAGVGAAAGAVVGQILTKNSKGTVIGAVIGAVSGGVSGGAARDSDILVPEGTRVMLTLMQPLVISGS